MIIPTKELSDLSSMIIADMLQLPPVKGKLLFSQFCYENSIKHLLDLQLWHLFKHVELTEVVRENDKLFIDLLNKVRVDNIDDDVENLVKARFIQETNEDCRKETSDMFKKNEPAMKRNEIVLNDLSGEFYTIEANDKIQDNCRYSLATIQAAQNQKQANQGGLVSCLN